MKRPVSATLALLAWLALATTAFADERILSYDSDVKIQADGSLDVTENIRIRAEGNNIRRGIYRDFPTRYKDRFDNRVVVDFKLLEVKRDGHYEDSFTESLDNGIRINTGDDSFLPVPAEYTYTIHYTTSRQLGFFPDHDELYWNVNGVGWDFPIDAITARVTLPSPVPSEALRLDGYTGPAWSQGKDYQATSPEPGVAVFRTTRLLAQYEGLTIAVGFPKGMIAEPTAADRFAWFLRDNGGILVGLAGLILLAVFYLWRWVRVGRDPQSGPIFPRYEPPHGFSPGELRMLRKMGNDQQCFSADVVDMGVRRFLQIHQGQDDAGWRLVKEDGASLGQLTASQRALGASLFKASEEIELKNTEATRVNGAIAAHAAEMTKRLKPRFFQSNGGNLLIGVIFSVLVGLFASALSGGHGVPALLVLGLLGLALHIAFAILLKAPTREGRKLMDEIEGLRMYLGVAERDELKSLQGPEQPPTLDAGRYEALLPYAMALEVEEAWTKKFTAAVGVAAAQESTPDWYHSHNRTDRMGLASIGNSLCSGLSEQISSSSTPPGSSSGGGGGGSSGGGGGGGGGGGR